MIEYLPWSSELVREVSQKASAGIFSCLEVDVSGQCPYNCIYCESPYRDRVSTLNIKKVCELIETKRFAWLYVCGIGEPMYSSNDEQLLTLLDCCYQHSVKCSVFTNLSNLSSQHIKYIKLGVLYVVFKLDSQKIEVLNTLYRPVDLDTHLANISRIAKLVQYDGTYTNIAASIVPTTQNVDEIPTLVQWCLDRNILPLVAQLEYAGAAVDIFSNLALDDAALTTLKQKLNNVCGEEYHLPLCPAVFGGLSITDDNKLVVDKRTGLSCHAFWLEDPDLEVICDNISDIIVHDAGAEMSYGNIINVINVKRKERYRLYDCSVRNYRRDVFGGCGGNKEDVLNRYVNTMRNNFSGYTHNDNSKINRYVYLDNNSTTQVSLKVRNEMAPYWDLNYANPSSKSQLGEAARRVINESRIKVASAVGAKKSQVFFTSSGSEGNNWAIHCCLTANKSHKQKNIILTTATEHASTYEKLNALKEVGYEIYYIDLAENGELDIAKLKHEFTLWDQVAFASAMLVNNETGIINDIQALSVPLRQHGILFHCDAVQALGKIEINLDKLGVDYLTISGHKIFAPKGIGAMIVSDYAPLTPLIYGHQESAKHGEADNYDFYRGGTENVAFIAALGCAIEDVYATRGGETFAERMARVAFMRNKIEEIVTGSGLETYIHGRSANRIVNTSNFGFFGRNALSLLYLLESRGIQVSIGAACDSGMIKPSRVLVAMNSPIVAEKAIRVSLSENTTLSQIQYFTDNLLMCIPKMRIMKGE